MDDLCMPDTEYPMFFVLFAHFKSFADCFVRLFCPDTECEVFVNCVNDDGKYFVIAKGVHYEDPEKNKEKKFKKTKDEMWKIVKKHKLDEKPKKDLKEVKNDGSFVFRSFS